MAKRQTRRSISITGLSYQTVQEFCEDEGRSVSGLLEDLIAEKMESEGRRMHTILRPKPKANTGRKPRGESDPAAFFPGYVEL